MNENLNLGGKFRFPGLTILTRYHGPKRDDLIRGVR